VYQQVLYLDLQPDNSWFDSVSNGNTVFMSRGQPAGIKRVDVGRLRGARPIAALNVAREISGAGQLNALALRRRHAGRRGPGRDAARGDDPVASLTC